MFFCATVARIPFTPAGIVLWTGTIATPTGTLKTRILTIIYVLFAHFVLHDPAPKLYVVVANWSFNVRCTKSQSTKLYRGCSSLSVPSPGVMNSMCVSVCGRAVCQTPRGTTT